jgi:hypothetical protein
MCGNAEIEITDTITIALGTKVVSTTEPVIIEYNNY